MNRHLQSQPAAFVPLLLILLLLPPSLASHDAESAVVPLFDENFNHHAGSGTWLVLFYSRHQCAACKSMLRIFSIMCKQIRDGDAPIFRGMGFKCGSVNADVRAAQELVLRLQPHRLPHLYIMVNGRKISEIAGDVSVDALHFQLQSLSSSFSSFSPSYTASSSSPPPSSSSSSSSSDTSSSSSPYSPPTGDPLPPPAHLAPDSQPSSPMWWQRWLHADWHLLRIPTSLPDALRLGTSLRKIGRQLAEGSLQAYTVAVILIAGMFGFATGVLFVAVKEVGLGGGG